jgi:predicted P-loop ATPase
VLEGEEGLGKTAFLRWLAKDNYASLNLNLSSKDAVLNIHGPLIIDFAEFSALKRSDAAQVLAFITERYDRVRKPYARQPVNILRRGVFAANSNDDAYLVTDSGNRRFIPIEVRQTIPRSDSAYRDALWAEARTLYFAGEQWHDIACDELRSATRRKEISQEDPWIGAICTWLDAKRVTEVTVRDLLSLALVLDSHQQNMSSSIRAGKILKRLGWVKRHTATGNVWCKT